MMMRMSYIFRPMMVLALFTLLCCCVKTEPVEMTESDSEICFADPIMSHSTKAVSGSIIEYPKEEHFTVSARYTPDDFVSWDSSIPYFDNMDAAYDADKNGWTTAKGSSAKAYYWPNSGKLTFAAYSPSDCPNASYGNDGLSVADFVNEQYDLLYAPRAMNKTASSMTSGVYDGVQLNFRHALSCVDFRVRNGANYEGSKIYIKSVKILNAYKEGDFAENITDGSMYEASPEWTDQKTETAYTFFESTPGQLVTVETLPLGVQDCLLMIPQKLDHGSSHVTIRLEYNDNGVDKVNDIDLVNGFEGGYFNDGTNEIREWELGKKYTYTITFGKYKIFFTPSVSVWEDSGTIPPVYI